MEKRGLFVRKPMRGHFDDAEGEHHLKRHLGPVHLTAIGIGAIIGAGIFVITGQAAASYAGPSIVISFMIAALICLLTGLCYAELASLIPISGGSYSYSYVAMGEFPAWLVGWTITAQYILAAATVSVGWSGYFVSFLEDFGISLSAAFTQAPFSYSPEAGWHFTGALINLPSICLVAFIGLMIAVGTRAVSYLNNGMVLIKIATILLFIAIGIGFIQRDNWSPFIPANTGAFGQFGWSGILRAAGLTFFAYIGFDAVSTLAQDAKNPQKDLPIGILGSLLICTVAYIVTSLVLTGIVSYTQLGVPDPMSVALQVMGPQFFWFKLIIKLAILAGLASVILVVLLGQTRVFYAMSRDGLLPAPFCKIHHRLHTPVFTSILTGIVTMGVGGLFPVNVLGELVSMMTLFLFAIVCLGVWILRKTHPEYNRSFKVPFVPFIPLLGIVSCLGQMAFIPKASWIQFIAWLILGLAVYFLYGINHSKIRRI